MTFNAPIDIIGAYNLTIEINIMLKFLIIWFAASVVVGLIIGKFIKVGGSSK